jgi:hypothetical protein
LILDGETSIDCTDFHRLEGTTAGRKPGQQTARELGSKKVQHGREVAAAVLFLKSITIRFGERALINVDN